MRSLLLTLVLVSAAAGAQPVLGPEVVSAPLPGAFEVYGFAPPALAGDGNAFAVAWSAWAEGGENRIYAAPLDATAHVAGAVQVMPTGLRHAERPVLTTTASGFMIGWTEVIDGKPRGLICGLDRQLVPVANPVLLGPGGDRVVLAASEHRVVAAYNGKLFELADDGSIVSQTSGVSSAVSLAVTPFRTIELGQTSTQTAVPCFDFHGHCGPTLFTSSYFLTLLDVGNLLIGDNFGFFSSLGAAVGFDGQSPLIVWYDGTPTFGGGILAMRVTPASYDAKRFPARFLLGSYPPLMDNTGAAPQIAYDGERYLVVWQEGKAISGALLDAAGKVTPLAIAKSGSSPNVIATSHGRFLVAYELRDAEGRHVAGRFIDVTSRRRASP